MTKLPLATAEKLEKNILQIGFKKVRQKGSHAFYKHSDGCTTPIPFHKGRVISRPLLREILREIEIGIDEFNHLLNQ
ncbi:MAG: type II toxin-antitoxin system HicA family toxin [Fibrobacterota bacterium]